MAYVREAAASPEAALARRRQLGHNLQEIEAARHRGATLEDLSDLARAEVQSQLPAFLAELRAALLAEVLARTARSTSASTSSSSSSRSSSAESGVGVGAPAGVPAAVPQAPPLAEFVSSAWTATRHAVAVGPRASPDPAVWQTPCGWKFGLSSGSRAAIHTDVDCGRCFPAGL